MSEPRVARCRTAEIFENAASAVLFAEYARECANPLAGPTTPQAAIYAALEGSGSVQCFGAYLDEALHGFAFVIIGPLPHYGRKFATVESLFVEREARDSGLGRMLMSAVEAWAQEQACDAIFYSAPAGSRLAQLLFLFSERYTNTSHVFTRRLW